MIKSILFFIIIFLFVVFASYEISEYRINLIIKNSPSLFNDLDKIRVEDNQTQREITRISSDYKIIIGECFT